MSDPRIRVRCYGGLLGDCFLLRLPRAGAADLTLLLDFGVLQHMTEGEQRLPAIADDVRALTGGAVDIVVVTHRHWDHVCGFGKAPNYADSIGELWMSWVENPDDDQGRRLVDGLVATETKLAAFADASTAALGVDADAFPELREIRNALSFTGSEPPPPGAPARKPLTTIGCLEAVRGKVKPDAAGRAMFRFFEPGQSVPIAGTGIVAHVLGPPRDEARLADQEPSADKHEVYALTDGMLGAAASEAVPGVAIRPPFDDARSLRFPAVPGENDAAAAWLAAHTDGEPWRRIDGVGMEALALKFDNIVNNTSLVLALELETGGDVLLFAADAQVGNWQSWHEIKWPDGIPAGFADDLLGRVVFYKVGHHGSINATASTMGLEKMTSGRLSAFIPVVETFARAKKPKPWDMPHESMRRRLEVLTEGRIARGDRVLPDQFADRPGVGTATFVPSPTDPTLPFYVDFEI